MNVRSGHVLSDGIMGGGGGGVCTNTFQSCLASIGC